jgi:hypothetical protein
MNVKLLVIGKEKKNISERDESRINIFDPKAKTIKRIPTLIIIYI